MSEIYRDLPRLRRTSETARPAQHLGQADRHLLCHNLTEGEDLPIGPQLLKTEAALAVPKIPNP
jgi:hypothetical protein